MLDYVQSVLGDATGLQASLQLQRPNVKLRDGSGKITETVISDVPDLIKVSGVLPESSFTQKGATLQVRFRRGQPFKGEPAFAWHINCEKGEIRLTSPSGSSIHANSYSEPVVIEVHDFASDEVRTVDWAWPEWQEEDDLPIVSRSVALLYEALHEDLRKGAPREYPDFADAVKRHEQLNAMLSGWSSA